jgi:hypothetical protein
MLGLFLVHALRVDDEPFQDIVVTCDDAASRQPRPRRNAQYIGAHTHLTLSSWLVE